MKEFLDVLSLAILVSTACGILMYLTIVEPIVLSAFLIIGAVIWSGHRMIDMYYRKLK